MACGNQPCPLSKFQWPEAASFTCFRILHTFCLCSNNALFLSVLSRTDQSLARYSQLNALANRRLKSALALTFGSCWRSWLLIIAHRSNRNHHVSLNRSSATVFQAILATLQVIINACGTLESSIVSSEKRPTYHYFLLRGAGWIFVTYQWSENLKLKASITFSALFCCKTRVVRKILYVISS